MGLCKGVIQPTKPYVSSFDIDKGARWSKEIAKNLGESSFGIICLTKDNLNEPWPNFEAGALSAKFNNNSKVTPFIFDINTSEIPSPLKQFQATQCNKKELKKLVHSINNQIVKDKKLATNNLNKSFEYWWPKLESEIHEIKTKTPPKKEYLHDVFISSPMAAYNDNKKYQLDRSKILDIIKVFEDKCNFKSIVYAGRDISSIYDFEAPDISVKDDLRLMKDSKYFVLIYPEKITSSVIFEAGWALALKKPSLYFLKNREDLPFLMRQSEQAFDTVKVYTYSNHKDILRLISKHKEVLFSGPAILKNKDA